MKNHKHSLLRRKNSEIFLKSIEKEVIHFSKVQKNFFIDFSFKKSILFFIKKEEIYFFLLMFQIFYFLFFIKNLEHRKKTAQKTCFQHFKSQKKMKICLFFFTFSLFFSGSCPRDSNTVSWTESPKKEGECKKK